MATRDPTFRGKLKQDGYSKEEKYFYELNRELIERRRSAACSPSEPSSAASDQPCKKPESRVMRFLKRVFGTREGSEDLF